MKRLFLRLFRLLYWAGIPRVFRFVHRHSLTIVLYHGVAPTLTQGIYNYRGKFIDPAVFEKQVEYMNRNYTILSLDDALIRLENGTLPTYPLVITFDDGYRNFFEHAYPVLRTRGIPATMFLATDFVCRSTPLWVDRLEYAIGAGTGSRAELIERDAQMRARLKTLSPEMREAELHAIEHAAGVALETFDDNRAPYAPLSADEIRAMSAHGITFGAHTRSHPILATQPIEQQQDEIAGSKNDIEALGVPVSRAFAYPNGQAGDWNNETETVLKKAGFSHALTTHEGANSRGVHPYRIKRIVLDNTNDVAAFANILSGVRLFVKSIL